MSKLGKFIDSVVSKILVFTFLFIWINYFVKNAIISVIVSFLLTLTIAIIAKTLFKNKKIKVRAYDYYNTIILLGNENAVKLYKSIYPNDLRYIRAILKFSPVSQDDILSIFRDNINDVVIICKDVKRNVKLFANTLPINIQFITLKNFTKTLKKHNALPEKIDVIIPKKYPSFEEFFEGIFSIENTKFYLFSGIALAIFTLVTPYKIYYIVLASVNLIFAFISKITN